MATSTHALSDLPGLVGQTLGVSEWLLIDQARIDAFAHATGDLQWIHVDPVRAAAGPFGSTVAHGFLTLSLLPLMGMTAIKRGEAGSLASGRFQRVLHAVNSRQFNKSDDHGKQQGSDRCEFDGDGAASCG